MHAHMFLFFCKIPNPTKKPHYNTTMSSGEVSASRVAMLNAILADHQRGTNKYVLGGKVRPTFGSGVTPGTIQAGAIDRKTGESVVVKPQKAGVMPTIHYVTGVVKLSSSWLDVRRSFESAQNISKQTGKPAKKCNQSITFELEPSDERLKSSTVAMNDLKTWFTEDVIKAWWDAGYKPNRTTKQASGYDEYKDEMLKLFMDTSNSPFGPLTETEVEGDFKLNFKASSKFTPYGETTRPEDRAICEAAGGDIKDFMDENPKQRLKFVELIHADGRTVKPDEYWEMVDTAFGQGSLVIVTLMCAYGGVTVFEGTKTSVQPKLVSIQEVERIAGKSANSSSGNCNLVDALAKYEAATEDNDEEEEDDEAELEAEPQDEDPGEKRKSQPKSKKSKGKRTKTTSDE